MTIRRWLWWVAWGACESMAIRSSGDPGYVLLWGLAGFSVAAIVVTSHPGFEGWWLRLLALGVFPVVLVLMV